MLRKPEQMSNEMSSEERANNNQKGSGSELPLSYDYIVCGAGSSGSVVAARLAANPHIRVLLLESGGTDDVEEVSDPNMWPRNLGSERDWGYRAETNPELNGRSIPYSMGKVLGGGSSINVCTWSRGHRADWDAMASAADDAVWGYQSVVEMYRMVENWQGTPEGLLRGTNGPVYVQPAQQVHPFSESLLDAAAAHGLERFTSPGGSLMEGAGGCAVIDEVVRDGKRRSIFQAYVAPLQGQANLTVLTRATVHRLRFVGKRAIGVDVQIGSELRHFEAQKEIVLSLGAIETPKLLMLSGIGPAEHLRTVGLDVLQDLPAVGQHLHDHVAIGVVWEASEVDIPKAPRSQLVCFWKNDPDLEAPDHYTYVTPVPSFSPENRAKYPVPERCWSLVMGMRPQSRGSVRLRSADPAVTPIVDAGYLTDNRDLSNLLQGLAFCRKLGNSDALKPFTKQEIAPGPLDDRDMEAFVRDGLVTFWHQCGTARIGIDEQSVVDGRLRVHGVVGLRIADTSVLPQVTIGNTMAPAVIIGEMAARFLLDRRETGASLDPCPKL